MSQSLQTGGVFSHYFFKYASVSSSLLSLPECVTFLRASHNSCRLSSLFHSFFSPLTGSFQMNDLSVHTFFLLLKSDADALCCSFCFLHWILQPWSFCLLLFYDFCVSVELRSLFVYHVPDFVELSILSILVGC